MAGDAIKRRYIARAVKEYEYSWAAEYEKRSMTKRAILRGTVDIDPNAVDGVDVAIDGAWVPAHVWVPREWLKATRGRKKLKAKS